MAKAVATLVALLITTGRSVEIAAQFRPVQMRENCTKTPPCTGLPGGVYFVAPSFAGSYLDRSEAPRPRVQETCTAADPASVPGAVATTSPRPEHGTTLPGAD